MVPPVSVLIVPPFRGLWTWTINSVIHINVTENTHNVTENTHIGRSGFFFWTARGFHWCRLVQRSRVVPCLFLKNKKLKDFHWSIKKNKINPNILGLRALGGKCAVEMNADRSGQFRMIWSQKKILIFHQTTTWSKKKKDKSKKQWDLLFAVATILAGTNQLHTTVTITVTSVKFWASNSCWKPRYQFPRFFGSCRRTNLVYINRTLLVTY